MPVPLKPAPFARQLFSAELISDISPDSYRTVLDRFIKVRPHVVFLPPSSQGTIIFPGFDGGAEWGGAAIDPRRGILYVNANEMPWILTRVETGAKNDAPLTSAQEIDDQICAACHGIDRQGDPARAYPTLVNLQQKLKQPDILQLLESGRGNMPAFAFLTKPQK